MKRIYLVALLALAALLCANSIAFAGTNLILNPGFETTLTGTWDDSTLGVPAERVTDINYKKGDYSVRKGLAVNTVTDYWSEISQTVTAAAGEPVYASVYVYTAITPGSTGRAILVLNFLDATDTILAQAKSNDIGGNNKWTKLEASLASAPAGTVKVKMILGVWALMGDAGVLAGNAYFDDAYLAKEAFPKLTRKLLNPGFENGLTSWADLYGLPSAISTTIIHKKLMSLKKTIGYVSTQEYWSQTYQELLCVGKKKAIASVYVKPEFTTLSAKAGLMIQFLDNKGDVIKTAEAAGIGGNQLKWKKINVAYPIPLGTAKVRISCTAFAPMGDTANFGASAYFDDAKLSLN